MREQKHTWERKPRGNVFYLKEVNDSMSPYSRPKRIYLFPVAMGLILIKVYKFLILQVKDYTQMKFRTSLELFSGSEKDD